MAQNQIVVFAWGRFNFSRPSGGNNKKKRFDRGRSNLSILPFQLHGSGGYGSRSPTGEIWAKESPVWSWSFIASLKVRHCPPSQALRLF